MTILCTTNLMCIIRLVCAHNNLARHSCLSVVCDSMGSNLQCGAAACLLIHCFSCNSLGSDLQCGAAVCLLIHCSSCDCLGSNLQCGAATCLLIHCSSRSVVVVMSTQSILPGRCWSGLQEDDELVVGAWFLNCCRGKRGEPFPDAVSVPERWVGGVETRSSRLLPLQFSSQPLTSGNLSENVQGFAEKESSSRLRGS